MLNHNPYSAPDSDVTVQVLGNNVDFIKQFKSFTTWGVVGLTMITLGIYSYYWIYSRTQTLNSIHSSNPIANWIPIAVIVLGVIGYFVGYAPMIMNDPQMAISFATISPIISIASLIIYITWAFSFRNRINEVTGANEGDTFWLGPVLTFFFSFYYFQYKINQMHDQG